MLADAKATETMPELPDITVYMNALEQFLGGRTLQRIVVRSPFLLRTFEPDLAGFETRTVVGFERLGKQVAWRFDNGWFLLFHLMIAGRFHWRKVGAKPSRKTDLAGFVFEHGVMMLTEASKKQRASLHALRTEAELESHRQGGLELHTASVQEFSAALRIQNRTLKRALTDPRLLSGIGNAYSDEILHAAKLSPVSRTQSLTDEQLNVLFQTTLQVLDHWAALLEEQRKGKFPEKVTAFRVEMAVHGKFGEACPVCQTPVQRIVYADNETNYCPTCQTGGKMLADRSLSRLLKDDWPKRIEPGKQP